MQVICIYAGIYLYEQKIDYVFNIFKNTLREIGVNVEIVDVLKINLSYYNGTRHQSIENIFDSIKNAHGVVFATTAQRLAPSGAMQVFLEHLDYNLYPNVLTGKPCLSIVTSSDNSEYSAGSYINSLVSKLGGEPINGMQIGSNYLENIEESTNITQMIERYAEDFYRIVNQGRKFFVPTPFFMGNATPNTHKNIQEKFPIIPQGQIINLESIPNDNHIKSMDSSQVANLYKREIENDINNYQITQNVNKSQNINYTDIYKNNGYNAPAKKQATIQNAPQTDKQKDEINHLVKLLSDRYKEETINKKEIGEYIKNEYHQNKIQPNINSIKQKTKSLPHYFQPHLVKDMVLSIQISIIGNEIFNGFISIDKGECYYTEGIKPDADSTIIADSEIWQEVLDGGSTLQKAFMLGRLKIKGNFIIISKFEQYFKIN